MGRPLAILRCYTSVRWGRRYAYPPLSDGYIPKGEGPFLGQDWNMRYEERSLVKFQSICSPQ